MITKIEVIKQRCEMLVIALVGKELAPKWWQSTNNAFDGKTPEVMFQEDPNAVYDYLLNHASK